MYNCNITLILIVVLIGTIIYYNLLNYNSSMEMFVQDTITCDGTGENKIDPINIMVGNYQLDKWFPYNYNLPAYYKAPYSQRFDYANHIWNSSYMHANYDIVNNTFLY